VHSTPVPDPPVDLLRVTGREGVEDYFKSVEPFYQR
jgi:hypothetical protein